MKILQEVMKKSLCRNILMLLWFHAIFNMWRQRLLIRIQNCWLRADTYTGHLSLEIWRSLSNFWILNSSHLFTDAWTEWAQFLFVSKKSNMKPLYYLVHTTLGIKKTRSILKSKWANLTTEVTTHCTMLSKTQISKWLNYSCAVHSVIFSKETLLVTSQLRKFKSFLITWLNCLSIMTLRWYSMVNTIICLSVGWTDFMCSLISLSIWSLSIRFSENLRHLKTY